MSVVGDLVDAIKALFTGNTTNAASQSGARVPIVQADGTPIGNDSMANLASVLGVILNIPYPPFVSENFVDWDALDTADSYNKNFIIQTYNSNNSTGTNTLDRTMGSLFRFGNLRIAIVSYPESKVGIYRSEYGFRTMNKIA